MNYETVIGLEVHAQLLTNSKMFCACSTKYKDATPNSVVCPICLGMPGTLPSINQKAIEHVVRTGLSLNCTISDETKFDRKNYPYPDLMKGYQISQFDQPIASSGYLELEDEDDIRIIRITRVHLEEDVAKLLHRSDKGGNAYSLLDINRAGMPLMEIVSDPDMRTPEEARLYLTKLQLILRYLGVSSANMEEGSFRCDANISIRLKGIKTLGNKVEVKNMNSFRSVYKALEYEIERQINHHSKGIRIVQETRGWLEDKEITVSQRSKEEASDYRYFPDPDLVPIVISRKWVETLKAELPELPQARKQKYVGSFGLSEYDSTLLSSSLSLSDLFESIIGSIQIVPTFLPKALCNWMLGELSRLVNSEGCSFQDIPIKPEQFIEFLHMIEDGTLSSNLAKTLFEEMFHSGESPRLIAEKKGMAQINDERLMTRVVEEALNNNPGPVEDYLNGKESALKYLIGQVMKASRGKANPKIVTTMLKGKLEDRGISDGQ